MKNENSKTLFTEEVIAQRIHEIGAEITHVYSGEPLTVVCILKGAFVFAADLIRKINLPLQIEFMAVTSYLGTESTGQVRIVQDLATSILNKHVLVVEDIIDSGITIDYLIDTLSIRNPKSLKVCTLLSKPHAHKMKQKIDFIGFEIGAEFVVGFGLDLDGKYRNIPYLAQIY